MSAKPQQLPRTRGVPREIRIRDFSQTVETVAPVWARYCVGCHKIEGDGGTDGPDLTHEGTKHDAPTLRRWIVDPEQVDPDAEMPSFGDRLTAAQLDAISAYLASRR